MSARRAALAATRPTTLPVARGSGARGAMRSRSALARTAAAMLGALCLTLALAAPLSAHVGSGTYRLRTTDLAAGPGQGVGDDLSCPRGKRVISGGAYWHRPGEGPHTTLFLATLSSSTATTDGKGWYASGLNGTSEALQLRIVVLCLPRANVGTYTLRTKDLAAAGGTRVGDYLACPAGKRVVSGGALWHRPGEGPDASLAADLASSTATTDGKGWYASGGDRTGATLQLQLVALCVPRGTVGTYTLATEDLAAEYGDSVGGYLACPAGKRVVSGGAYWHLPGQGPDGSQNVYLTSSTPTTDGKGWYASGRSLDPTPNGTEELQLVVLCVTPR